MLSAEIISALIKLSWWIKPGLNRLYYFIVGAFDGKESSDLTGQKHFLAYRTIINVIDLSIFILHYNILYY
jgi:hypothetical protein